jgi:hypothetical protein
MSRGGGKLLVELEVIEGLEQATRGGVLKEERRQHRCVVHENLTLGVAGRILVWPFGSSSAERKTPVREARVDTDGVDFGLVRFTEKLRAPAR